MSSEVSKISAITEPADWNPPRWVVPLFALGALLLVPWVALLAATLPSAHQAEHWDIAWAGFDVALALLFVAVAVAAWRRSPWLESAAAATATLLVVDAWFDVLTSSTRTEYFVSIGEAAFVELPLAVLCLLLARNAERWLRGPPLERA
jgi:predicted branched-subunit amino acid permease